MLKIKFTRKQLSIPYALFLVFFVFLPLLLIIYYAFSGEDGKLTINNFINFFSGSTNLDVFARSVLIGLLNTIICLLIAYPLSYFLSNKKYNKSYVIVLMFIMPMWINFVLRTGATRDLLAWIGINSGSMPYFATMVGMVYNYLPFAILPLYTTMLKMDKSLIEASYDLGATPFKTFFKTIIPVTMPGIVSAITMVFMPTMSSYVISDIMSGCKISIIGNLIQLNFDQSKWHAGSLIALIMLMIIGLFSLLTMKVKKEDNVRGALW